LLRNIILINLTTTNQRKKKIFSKKYHSLSPALKQCPQVRGRVVRLKIITPRKPNSARRPVVKSKLVNRRRVTAHIPGIGHSLRRFSEVLIKGTGPRDLPGVNYRCCRGVYDLGPVLKKKRRKSIYGVSNIYKPLRRKERIKLGVYSIKRKKK
jgi:small subunit ribosomal protein S12